MSGVHEFKDDEESELERLRTSADLLEKEVAERVRIAKNEAEKKALEVKINDLKRKLEMIDSGDSSQLLSLENDATEKDYGKQSSAATKFPDADGKLYYVVDKRDLPQRMEDSQGFRRACDPRRHRELLLSEGTLINVEHVRQRLEARGGDNLLATSVDTIWESTALWDKVRLFKVFSGKPFEAFMKFNSHWKDYTVCSLQHFVSGLFNEEDRSGIVMALDGLQTMFTYVYGSVWGEAWEPIKKKILMGSLRLVNGPYLRFELEIAWSSFCTIMRHAYYDKDDVLVDISQSQSCVDILLKLYDAVSANTARELHFQNSLTMTIIITTGGEKVNKDHNSFGAKGDVSILSGVASQVGERKNKREGLICMAQLLHTFGVAGNGGKVFEQCPHGKQCVFGHIGKHDKPKDELRKAVDSSKAKLLTKPVRRALMTAIQKS